MSPLRSAAPLLAIVLTSVGVLSLAKGERIVTVGRAAVYVSWKDGDDIERLRRHPLPGTLPAGEIP